MDSAIDFSRGMMPHLAARLLEQPPFHTGEWQSKDVSTIKQYATHELQDVTVIFDVPDSQEPWAKFLGSDVNHAWAEEHFRERVGGVPLNPPPSHERWPWSRHNANHQNGPQQVFSHTYPERMWPKHAGEVTCRHGYVTTGHSDVMPVDKYGQADNGQQVCNGREGIRFAYGDLDDVVDLLVRSPFTRQAFLPIWFPEDTGAHHRQRVPCTLGYHFMIRDGRLSCRYYMRSCDLIRHFPDDVYMAGRLMQWMCDQINHETGHEGLPEWYEVYDGSLQVGRLVMHIASLHVFVGDQAKLIEIVRRTDNGRSNQ